ncbi:rCG27784 [Rattus norvegicus]|uniref:RCG27784 n=1 Tax=Rattus norvegicus TaxID=10116 RepID=A6KBP3_RAT|nr:rCG27784 [Rattus norvegicus]
MHTIHRPTCRQNTHEHEINLRKNVNARARNIVECVCLALKS